MAIENRYRVLENNGASYIDMHIDVDYEVNGTCYVMKQDGDRIVIAPDQLNDVITVLAALKEQASKRGVNG